MDNLNIVKYSNFILILVVSCCLFYIIGRSKALSCEEKENLINDISSLKQEESKLTANINSLKQEESKLVERKNELNKTLEEYLEVNNINDYKNITINLINNLKKHVETLKKNESSLLGNIKGLEIKLDILKEEYNILIQKHKKLTEEYCFFNEINKG